MKGNSYQTGLKIEDIAVCDFSKMVKVDNEAILKRGRGETDPRLIRFLVNKMGVGLRYHCPEDKTSLDLAKDALEKLIEKNPGIVDEAEFFILAGISNPMPTVCTSSLLAGDYGFAKASCWDLKSGCSTGILAFLQALDWVNRGVNKGVIVCTEAMSKFANPEALQMSAATGDGAVAMIVKSAPEWKVRGTIHGTDSKYMRSIYVPGTYPVKKDFNPMEYVFAFEDKGDTLERMGFHWQNSLKELLEFSEVKGEEITDYVAHQVDGTKNKLFAKANNIKDEAIALNFKELGNMGCPTVFINYKKWVENKKEDFKAGDKLVLHAVGGGLSWAGICMEKIS